MNRRDRLYDVLFYVPAIAPLLATNDVGSTGGAETQSLLVARALARRGLRVCICAFDVSGADIPRTVEGIDVVLRRPYVRRGWVARFVEALALIRDIGKIEASAVVTLAAGYHVGLVGIAARMRMRRFVYWSVNRPDFDRIPPYLTDRPYRLLYRLGLRLANEIVVQTAEQEELCRAGIGRSSTVVTNPVEAVAERAGSGEAFLWVGRGVWYKQPLEYVELARAVPEARFWAVCAPGAEGEDITAELKQAAAGVANLELLPPRPQALLMPLLERAVAIVNTSSFEGMPNASLEGWARGVPTLALFHDPGGVIEANELGTYAGGSRERLVAATRELWRSRGNSAALAGRCRAYAAREHSEESVAESWVQVLCPPLSDTAEGPLREVTGE